ncbi:hypothetical protein BDF21DRAFT_477488 [Thamnidium elegans]|uniref:Uncharacterized protein n=1 Tax=Thamnidium elegans TaxID=101142 RepID=A0A8H7SNJ7_9FUNG|nr:hypothetical protein INT48_008490 [Thamnidium elegans]KAI8067403.1 hypothetical protein BDF21DRAFT_477488 [Thamnidium elegans]
MDAYPNIVTITNAVVFSNRIFSTVNNQGVETLTFLARLLDSQVSVIIRTTAAQMREAMQPVYTRYRINALEQSSVLRIDIKGNVRRARNYSFLEQPETAPLFVLVATELHIVNIIYTIPRSISVESVVISNDETEKDVGTVNNDNDDICDNECQAGIINDDDKCKDPDYSSGDKRTRKHIPKSSSKNHKRSESLRINPRRRGRQSTPFSK